MKKEIVRSTPPITSQGCVPVYKIKNLLTDYSNALVDLKQQKCVEIWNRIATKSDNELLIDDQLWERVRSSFSESTSSSLIKFLSSYICQTSSFKMTKEFFLFNLASAADQRKFFLYENLFG